jgi:putative component of membrane protein insertase Oxa1/YidC/SpoIIIJ protein YidD
MVSRMMKKIPASFCLYLFLLVGTLHTYEEPWGKDATLLAPKVDCAPFPSRSLSKELSCALIRFHQEVISPADGPRSHYLPSSSQYTYDAIQRYGFLKGWLLGCDRLMRENDEPWIYRKALTPDRRLLKWNPIP